MPSPNSLADRLKLRTLLRDRVRPLLGELTHLATDHATFEQELASLVTLDQLQQSLTADLRETTRLRDEADGRVTKIRNRLAAGLQAQYGPDSEKLIEFGINPRRRRRGRKKEEEPPVAGGTAGPAQA